MQLLHQKFYAVLQPENAFENPHGGETAPVRHLQEAVHPERPPQVAQAGAHQRAALHVRRLPEEVQNRQQTTHSLEEEQM